MAPLAELSALSGPAIPSPDQSRSREVLIRAVSALALSGLLAACLYVGWPFFHLLVLAATLIMAWEWARLCGRGVLGAGGYALIAACAGIVVLASFALHTEASLVFIAAAPLVALMAQPTRASDAVWLGAGVLYVGGGTWAAIALFDLYQHGVWIVVWGGVLGLVGLMLAASWVGTDHDFWRWNENLLYANPLLLAAPFLAIPLIRGLDPSPRLRELLRWVRWVALGAVVLKLVPGIFVQENWEIVAALVPTHMMLARTFPLSDDPSV
mgnify:CR=1 FL=1